MSDSITKGGVYLLLLLFIMLVVVIATGHAESTAQAKEYPYNGYSEQVIGYTFIEGERYEVIETIRTTRHLRK